MDAKRRRNPPVSHAFDSIEVFTRARLARGRLAFTREKLGARSTAGCAGTSAMTPMRARGAF